VPSSATIGVNGHEIPTEEEDFLCVGVATIAFQPGRISTAQWTRTTTKQRSINNSWAMSFGAPLQYEHAQSPGKNFASQVVP
jgi:hypothetical protein